VSALILCCGEALIDFIPTPDGKAYQPCPGGSILNIAVGLGRMAVPVGFLSRLSTDLFGDLLAKHLTSNAVDLQYCPRVDGQTTLAFVSLNEGELQEPQYAFYAMGAVDREMSPSDLPEKLGEGVKALHFGSISLVLEPGASALEALMQRESRQRVLTLDPNVRPILISDWAAYQKRFEQWLEWVDILRLSQADLDLLYPEIPIDALLPQWFESGLSLVILTCGVSGSNAYLPDGTSVSVPAFKVIVKDTVGAGDTFFAGALTYLHEHNFLSGRMALRKLGSPEIKACLAFASKAAGINCTRAGADPPTRQEMDS
jgi:fructokinase